LRAYTVVSEPFLEVIRSEETTGPVTSLALSAVSKFLSYNLIGGLFTVIVWQQSYLQFSATVVVFQHKIVDPLFLQIQVTRMLQPVWKTLQMLSHEQDLLELIKPVMVLS